MFELFMYAANAILPIVLLLLLGFVLKLLKLMDRPFMVSANNVLFQALMPIMFFMNVYRIQELRSVDWTFCIFCSLLQVLFFIAAIFVARFSTDKQNCRAVLIHAVFFSNFGIIGTVLAQSLAGDAGLASAMSLFVLYCPMSTIFALLAYGIFPNGDEKFGLRTIIDTVWANNMMKAAFLGIAALIIRLFIPTDESGELIFSIPRTFPFLYSALEKISKATSVFALVVLGGMLDFGAFRGRVKEIIVGTTWRVFLTPVIGLSISLLCAYLGYVHLGPPENAALIAVLGSPIGFLTVTLAMEYGGDETLASQIVIWTHIFPFITLFAIAMLYRYYGLL